MEITRLQIIFVMGLSALAMRAVPQLFFVGQTFPEAWDRWLHYLSYGFICSIISVTLFMSGGRLETAAAPRRTVALALTIFIAHKTKSAVTGMIAGALLVIILSWLR
ncbi:MAG: AzlD domain-containing protein [Candidatus Binatia bacterium]